MKNYLLLALTLCLMACGAPNKKNEAAPLTYSQQMVESHGLIDFYCNRKHHDSLCVTGWDYVSGLVANAVLKTWAYYPERLNITMQSRHLLISVPMKMVPKS